MSKSIILVSAALCLMMQIHAVNHMDIMQTIYGEFNGDEFGANLLVMDFNGDGYDDLIVRSNKWNETGVYDNNYYPGKIYFYWGGPGFDNIPDFIIEGQWHKQYGGSYAETRMCDAGDMNGDGFEDLALNCNYDHQSTAYKSTAVFLGRQVPQTEPDYIITYPQTFVEPRALGDINGDGFDDIAINGVHFDRYPPFCYIWTDLESQPVLFRNMTIDGSIKLSGVGDVNGDGYDDAYLSMPFNPTNSLLQRAVLFYGDSIGSMSDSLVISDNIYHGGSTSYPLGDLNGDGYGDFIGYMDFVSHYIWLGSATMSASPDLQLSYDTNEYLMYFGAGSGVYAVYGDLNGDGYDDFVCSDNTANSNNGQAGIWLGGQNVNATVDLVLDPPSNWEGRNYGWTKAIGDFNGDGLDDIAISCPWWGTGGSFLDTGRIYVYSGNTELEDTTTGVNDPGVPQPGIDAWDTMVYPNPSSKESGSVKVILKGDGYKTSGDYSYTLYNIRGQAVSKGNIALPELNIGQFALNLQNLSAGIYQIAIKKYDRIITTNRLMLF
jgi:hypothetical protein